MTPRNQPGLSELLGSDVEEARARASTSLHDKCKLMNMVGEG